MIRTITHREYLISCDGCGRTGPAAATPDGAGREVSGQGWRSVNPIRGFAFLATWFCPACQRCREGPSVSPAVSGA
jgi:hypothetical protein